jgi:hypothetical protein
MYPAPTLGAATKCQISPERRKNSKLSVVSIHRREDDAERGPRSLSARRQSRKLLPNDLNIGFDRGEIGTCLIRVATLSVYLELHTRYDSIMLPDSYRAKNRLRSEPHRHGLTTGRSHGHEREATKPTRTGIAFLGAQTHRN